MFFFIEQKQNEMTFGCEALKVEYVEYLLKAIYFLK